MTSFFDFRTHQHTGIVLYLLIAFFERLILAIYALGMVLGFTSMVPYFSDIMKQLTVSTNQGLKATNPVSLVPSALLGFYVPGVGAQFLPKNLGIKIPKGSQIKVQMHYNTDHNPDGLATVPDQSRFEYMIQDSVGIEMVNLPIMNPWWVFSKSSMLIPAGAPSTTYSSIVDPFLFEGEGLSRRKQASQLKLYSTIPHMHMRAKRAQVNIIARNGTKRTILSTDNYDFNFQENYNFAIADCLVTACPAFPPFGRAS